MDDVLQRIDETIHFMQRSNRLLFEGYEPARDVSVVPRHYLGGHNYLCSMRCPFYFHVTTAYGILRFAGVDVGKADYLGEQNWKKSNNKKRKLALSQCPFLLILKTPMRLKITPRHFVLLTITLFPLPELLSCDFESHGNGTGENRRANRRARESPSPCPYL